MNTSNKTRWSVKISKETDIAVRGFLAQRGLKKGDISKFVEEAVRWRVLDQTVEEARARFSDMPKKKLQSLIGEATQSLRTVKAPKARKSRQSKTA